MKEFEAIFKLRLLDLEGLKRYFETRLTNLGSERLCSQGFQYPAVASLRGSGINGNNS